MQLDEKATKLLNRVLDTEGPDRDTAVNLFLKHVGARREELEAKRRKRQAAYERHAAEQRAYQQAVNIGIFFEGGVPEWRIFKVAQYKTHAKDVVRNLPQDINHTEGTAIWGFSHLFWGYRRSDEAWQYLQQVAQAWVKASVVERERYKAQAIRYEKPKPPQVKAPKPPWKVDDASV